MAGWTAILLLTMNRQETKRAISDLSLSIDAGMAKGLLNPAQIRILIQTKKELKKDLAGWLEGDPVSEVQEF